MYFSAVDLPEDLIQAHRDGRLVIFVGAGASRAEPSGLPDFRRLAQGVATAVHAGELDLDEDSDILLGRLVERGIHVNQLVADRLSGGQPNALHRATVFLATTGSAVRLVTTNYDRHLSSVFAEASLKLDEFRAPALPMGDDIEGLVYLHGSLDQDPRHLIVTDRDFGRAYLRDAWAARFLERMYATYTVLFIGYSVSDVVMRYLARSLSNTQPRYAFTSTPADDDWRRLGIRPLGYEAAGSDHSHLVDVIDEWATESSRGLLEHRQRVRELVAAPPTGVPDEESYLEATVADSVRVRFFAEFAEHAEWLSWIQQKSLFPTLFDARRPLEPAAQKLASWFVDRFVFDEGRTSLALAAVRDGGGSLSPDLWWPLGRRLSQTSPRPSWLGPWLVLLVEQAPPESREWLEYILADAALPAERPAAILLFEHLTRPQGALQPSVVFDARLTVSIPGDEHWLREAWVNRLAPDLPNLAPDILGIADRHLRRAHQLLGAAAAHVQPFDSLHYARSAISPHPQDAHPEAIDVLVDAARDSLEAALDAGIPIAHGYLDVWICSRVPLLRRLAVHGWSYRSDVSATDKLDWLLRYGGLFDDDLQTETFQLLRQAVSDLDEPGVVRLVDEIADGPDVEDDGLRDRSRFDVLHWVLEARPDLTGANELLGQVQARHPDWEVRSHPELKSWVQTGFREPQPPMSVEELHRRILEEPAAALDEVQPYRDVTFSLTGPTWDDVLGLISGTVQRHPEDGLYLFEQDSASEVRAAIVRGWSQAGLSVETVQRVLDQLIELGTFGAASLVREIAEMLAVGGRREGHPTQWCRFPSARLVAKRLWDSIDPVDDEAPAHDWLGRAINHPAGKLAEFWLDALASDWQDAGDSWTGMPSGLAEPLEQMLNSGDTRTHLAEPVLASHLRLLHGADPAWTQRHILPLLSWESPDRALRAWHGYLYWGRPTRQLLEAGLLEHYLEAAREATSLNDELRLQLARHLAGIATSPAPPPELWVSRFVSSADDELRGDWAEAIARMLKDLPEEEIEAQWTGWFEPYWQQRISSVPRSLSFREASAMAGWTPHLGANLPRAAALAAQTPAGLDQYRFLLRDLAGADALTTSHRGPISELLAHLLLHTTKTLWDCHTLHAIVDQVRAGAAVATLDAIREHAFRLGCTDAPNW